MSKSVIADFVAKIKSSALGYTKPKKGRVILSKKGLVLVAGSNKVSVPLSKIADVTVGQVPDDYGGFFDAGVNLAFQTDGRGHTAMIKGSNKKIEKFSDLLFKAMLNGTLMMLKHPADEEGDTDARFTKSKLRVDGRQVMFRRPTGPFEIDLSTVANFYQTNQKIAGSTREVLSIRHLRNGEAVRTLAATDSAQKMSLLDRYIRTEYTELREDIEEVELSDDALELLIAAYKADANVSLSSIVDKDPSQVTMILNDLSNQNLVRDGAGGTELTTRGRVIVTDNIDDEEDEDDEKY